MLDEIVREEVASAVKYTISTMPIQLIIENSLVEYMDKTVDDNYYFLSNRAADALLSAKLDLGEAIERAIMNNNESLKRGKCKVKYSDTGLEVALNKSMFDAKDVNYDGKTFVVPMTREFAAADDKDEYMLTFSPDGMDDAMLVEFCSTEKLDEGHEYIVSHQVKLNDFEKAILKRIIMLH